MSAAKRLSPGAALLRRSRLIAMPAPIAPPPSHFLTNTSACPHPTVQSITTPASSHSRGNWGLKRDLPTKTKYPYLRYTALDTLEHFTTYESAADDVLTVMKWQEMDIPLVKGAATAGAAGMGHSYAKRGETVFEYKTGGGVAAAAEAYKWRYKGPYLPDMTAAEFRRFVADKIRPRRADFIEYTVENPHLWVPAAPSSNQQSSSSSSWGSPPSWAPSTPPPPAQQRADPHPSSWAPPPPIPSQEPPQPPPPPPAQEPADPRALRADPTVLARLTNSFLDLPTYTRPHRTHPSAGLYYTRSSAHARNPPVLGPQLAPKAVPGRHMNYASSTGVLVGVGGIVAKLTAHSGRLDDTIRVYNNRLRVEKYTPRRASVDALGRVMVEVEVMADDAQRGGYGERGFAEARRGREAVQGDILKGLVGGRVTYNVLYEEGQQQQHREGGGPGRAAGRREPYDVLDLFPYRDGK